MCGCVVEPRRHKGTKFTKLHKEMLCGPSCLGVFVARLFSTRYCTTTRRRTPLRLLCASLLEVVLRFSKLREP